jgi:cytidyltransferase-like protein
MRTAICSGSFDPITLGHLDIIRRAAACFDKVWVCVSPNAEKKNQMFTPEQKLLLVQTAVADLPNVEAELGPGLLADFAVERLHYVGTDMATLFMKGIVDAMDDALFEQYLAYHFLICERPDMVGATHHMLDIFQKQ